MMQDNKDMCKNLGVKVLPFFQFFRGAEGKIDQFSCSISKIGKFKVGHNQQKEEWERGGGEG